MRYEVRFIRPDPDRDENMVIDLADADKVVGIRGYIVILSPVAQGPPVARKCGFLWTAPDLAGDSLSLTCDVDLDEGGCHEGDHLSGPGIRTLLSRRYRYAAMRHDFPRPPEPEVREDIASGNVWPENEEEYPW